MHLRFLGLWNCKRKCDPKSKAKQRVTTGSHIVLTTFQNHLFQQRRLRREVPEIVKGPWFPGDVGWIFQWIYTKWYPHSDVCWFTSPVNYLPIYWSIYRSIYLSSYLSIYLSNPQKAEFGVMFTKLARVTTLYIYIYINIYIYILTRIHMHMWYMCESICSNLNFASSQW